MSNSSAKQFQSKEGQPFYKKFELKELGVDTDAFLEHIRPAYEMLRWDYYDIFRGGLSHPTRKRGIAEFEITKEENGWNVERVPAQHYQQRTDHGAYERTIPREYREVSEAATNHPEVVKFQKAIADIVSSVRTDATKLRVILTFLRTVNEEKRNGTCAIEGTPHSDGADFIVSALVVSRENLKLESGESSVYSSDGTELMRAVLQPSEGIFQDDINLLHHITNIQREVPDKIGIRDILGVDVEVLQ